MENGDFNWIVPGKLMQVYVCCQVVLVTYCPVSVLDDSSLHFSFSLCKQGNFLHLVVLITKVDCKMVSAVCNGKNCPSSSDMHALITVQLVCTWGKFFTCSLLLMITITK